MKNLITPEFIKKNAPSVFATNPDSKMSSKYSFIPTIELMENFEKEGWILSSVRQLGSGIHSAHELRYRNGELPNVGDTIPEAIIKNSHNGSCTLSVSAGLYRLCCSNGLTVPTAVTQQFNVRHMGFDSNEVKKLTESFAKKLPFIQNSVDKMMDRMLTEGEKIDFAKNASIIKWGMGSVPFLDYEELITPQRQGDTNDDLWTTFNIVQEKFVKGGLEYRGQTGKKTSLRGLKNFVAINQINTKLWDLAETLV